MIILPREIIDGFYTDSDVLDYAEENNLSLDDLEYAVQQYLAKGTACEGCGFIGSSNSYPCMSCSRNKKDYFNADTKIRTIQIK